MKKIFLHAAAYVLLIVGGIFVCTFLLSTAYDAGVRSAQLAALSSTAVQKTSASQAASQSHAPSAANSSKQTSFAVETAAQNSQNRCLVLVGPGNPFPSWYQPELTEVFGIKVDKALVQPFTEMRTDASKDGISLWISSGYRSDSEQSNLFQREVEQYVKTAPTYSEAVAAAERSVARPGCSEHATGLALDLNGVKDDFDTTPAFRWLQKHAYEYGFILRYPKGKENVTNIKYEPWHYRYVGKEAAAAMKKSGQCLEEYLAGKTSSSR
jgi:D-alanyl-D-alanine carboxypeptidase